MAEVAGLAELKRNLKFFKYEALIQIMKATYHGVVLIANEARDNHPYTDRTGNLTQSIQTKPAELKGGNKITAEVHAGMEYAAAVELGGTSKHKSKKGRKYSIKRPAYPYLLPAMENMSQVVKQGIISVINKIRWVE